MSVVVCGNTVCDILAHPVDEIRYGATTLVESVERHLGGNAGSTSCTIAKLGVPVHVATLVGRDADGEFVLKCLAGAGVDLSLVQRVDAATSVAIALIRAGGERALLYQLGASASLFQPFDFPPDATHFHLAAVYRMRHLRTHGAELLRAARERGLRTSLDTQWDTEGEWMKVLAPSLPFADYTLVNEDEARMLTGSADPEAAAAVLREHGASHVVVKLGSAGCWVDGVSIPGHPVRAVDTTGAGDCFAGAFVAALQRGFEPAQAARVANAVGAMAVQKVGATSGVADWQQSLAFLS